MEVPTAQLIEMFQGFSAKEWEDLTKRLAWFFSRNYEWDRRLVCEELVQTTFAVACAGGSHWDPEKGSLVTFLCRVIMRREASHIIRQNNKRPPVDSLDGVSEITFWKKDDATSYFELCHELRSWVASDPLLTRIINLIIEDPEIKPRHLRELLRDVPRAEIHKAHRRLTRIIRKKEQENGQPSQTRNQAKGNLRAGKAVLVA